MALPTARIRADRLAFARRAAGLDTDAALARAMGMHPSNIARTLSGDSALTHRFVVALLGAFPRLGFDDLLIDEAAADVEAGAA